MPARLRVALAVATLSSAALLAQGPPAAPPAQETPAPTFRSTVDLAQIDVFVTDDTGAPVAGLAAGDFELLENGVPRPITTFEAVEIPIEPAPAPARGVAEPDVRSNTGPPGRVYMFALDEVAPCHALRTRHFLRAFLDRHFGPHDVAAVALVGTGLATDGQDFTSNRRLLLAAIDKFSGGFGPACRGVHAPPRGAAAGRSQQMAGLRVLTETLARVPGRHKAMLLFTGRVDVNMFDIVDYAGGVLGLAGEDAHAAMRAATRGNVTIYPIDPAGLTPEHIQLETLGSMTALGHITGGFALFNSNSVEEAFARIVRETSTYYMLGFDSSHEATTGRYVRVDVRVKRPGLTVHARDGYVSASRDERRVEREASAPASAVAEALASPVATSGVALRLTATPFRGAGRSAVVDLVTEIDATTLPLAERDGLRSGTLDLRTVVTTHRDKSYPEVRHTTALDIERPPPGTPSPVRLVSRLELPEGRYQVRVAAGTEQVAGSVVYDLEVPDFTRSPLAMSGLSLSSRAGRRVPTLFTDPWPAGTPSRCRPPECRTDVVEGALTTVDHRAGITGPPARTREPATTARAFTADDTLTLYAEIYVNQRPRGADATRLTITTDLRDANGAIVRRLAEPRLVAEPQATRDVTITLPLEDVAPGAYVIRVEAATDDGRTSPVSRAIPIVVK